MAYLSERVSYIKGLMDGMNFDTTTNEGKLFKAIIDVLDDMAMSIEDTEETQDQVIETLNEVSESLEELEDVVYDDCDCDCDCCGEDDESFCCPECGEELPLEDLDIDENTESIVCPACKTEIELEWDDEDCCCDCCGCDCDEE